MAQKKRAVKRKPAQRRAARRAAKRRQPKGRGRRRHRRFLLFATALAIAAALLWAVVNLARPTAQPFSLPSGDPAAPTPVVEIDDSDRRQLEKVLQEIDKDGTS